MMRECGQCGHNVDAGKESMHLTADDLKNPILDYVKHIVLSPPGATFACATAASPDGKTYDNYTAVEEDFLSGDITPEQLKRALIDALNELLQPVRDHFANDDTARGLLEEIREYKRNAAPAASSEDVAPKAPRLDLVGAGVVPAGSHLVFAPLPNSNPTLQSAADLLAKLEAVAEDDDNAPRVLMLLDWTARVNGALDADTKLIAAYHSVLLSSLRALDEHFHGEDGKSVMKNVTVITQSEAILKDPSNYWISVINAGRHFTLDAVMGIGLGLGEGMKDSEGVGKVIGRLMMVADVLAVNPKSIALDATTVDNGEEVVDGVASMKLDGEEAKSVEAHLIQQFYSAKLSHPALASALPLPQITHVTSGPKLALQPPRESDAHKMESDEYFLADDPKVHGKSKVKKAFCEPGNVGFCPPIELLAYFGGLSGNGEGGEVKISRSPDNGGDVTYTTKSAILADFEAGTLHPGDLKGAVSAVMVGVLTRTSAGIKADGEAAKGVKALKAFEKKMAKQKKK